MNEKQQTDLLDEAVQNDPTSPAEALRETQEPVTAEENLQPAKTDQTELSEQLDVEITEKSEQSTETASAEVPAEIGIAPSLMNPKRLVFGILCAILVFGGGIILGLTLGGVFDAKSDIDPNIEDYDGVHADQDVVAQGSYSAPGYSEVTLPAGKKTVQIVLPNPVGNPCYLRFTLVLTEQNEVIYRSGLIPPGKAVSEITLTRALEKGTYQMEIRIEAVTLEEKEQMNGVTMSTVLTVK